VLGQVFLLIFERPPSNGSPAIANPPEELQRVGRVLVAAGSGTMFLRAALLAVPLWLVWSLAGAWIARAELVQQRDLDGAEVAPPPAQLLPTRWVLQRGSSVCKVLLLILSFAGCVLLPGLILGAVNRLPFLGPLLLAVGLPILFAFALVAALVLVGLLSCSIMPAAAAAEGGDAFDILARGYSYLYQRPFYFAWWCGLSLAIAAVPFAVLAGLQSRADGSVPAWGWMIAAVVSLSLFWTLQSRAYVKLRRIVDSTPEDEIGDLATTKGQKPSTPPPATSAGSGESEQSTTTTDCASQGPPEPARTEITFSETLDGKSALNLKRLIMLVVGMLWAGLVLALTALAARAIAGLPQPPLTLSGLREAVAELRGLGAATALVFAIGVGLLGTLGLARLLKAVARSAAVQTVFGADLPWRTAWASARRLGWRGSGSVVLLTAGIELYLATLFLLALNGQITETWHAILLLGGLGLVLLEVGALGLGAVAVEGPSLEDAPAGAFATCVRNGPETLASAVAAQVGGAVRCLSFAGFAWFTWLLMCENLSWWGGDHARWLRWGLDGRLVPESEPGVYQAASAIAGIWFLLLTGLVLAYPISYVLGWGVRCYLRARQQSDEIPPGRIDLSADEEQAERAARTRGRKMLSDLHEQAAKRGIASAASPPSPPATRAPGNDASTPEVQSGGRPTD
jgi:hypothetical protein